MTTQRFLVSEDDTLKVSPTEAAAMAATVPAGWQLVPIEPTKEMLHEGARRKYAWENGGGAGTAHAYKYFDETIKHSPSGEHCAEGMWRAILNAAPQAPVAGQPAEPSPVTADFAIIRSIIHECPALRLPQSVVERLGGVAQIVALKGASPEVAQFIADACNAACVAADAAIAQAKGGSA